MRVGGGLAGTLIAEASEPSCCRGVAGKGVDVRAETGGVNAGASAVSLGDEVETASLGGSQRNQAGVAR
jgi:hypothetical protein